MSEFTLYLGSCSDGAIEKARARCPSLRFGHTWALQKQTPHDNPWILDNGVFSAHVNDRAWNSEEWADTVAECADKMPRPPTFVVLPDAIGDSKLTYQRSAEHRDIIPDEWPAAYAAQDGMSPDQVTNDAIALDCDWIFVGGTPAWKRRNAPDIVNTARNSGLRTHIARPSVPGGIMWAMEIGAESADTTSIVRTPAWWHLDRIQSQQTLSDVIPDA